MYKAKNLSVSQPKKSRKKKQELIKTCVNFGLIARKLDIPIKNIS
jgi:hypothetical protein